MWEAIITLLYNTLYITDTLQMLYFSWIALVVLIVSIFKQPIQRDGESHSAVCSLWINYRLQKTISPKPKHNLILVEPNMRLYTSSAFSHHSLDISFIRAVPWYSLVGIIGSSKSGMHPCVFSPVQKTCYALKSCSYKHWSRPPKLAPLVVFIWLVLFISCISAVY